MKSITKKVLTIFGFTLLLIIITFFQNNSVLGVKDIPESGSLTESVYMICGQDIRTNDNLFCIQPQVDFLWTNNGYNKYKYKVVGKISIDSQKKEFKREGNTSKLKSDDDAISIIAFTDYSKTDKYKKQVEEYKEDSKSYVKGLTPWEQIVVTDPTQYLIWYLHGGAIRAAGEIKWNEIIEKMDANGVFKDNTEKEFFSIFSKVAFVLWFRDMPVTPTKADILARKEIKADQSVEPKIDYDASKNNEVLAKRVQNLPTGTNLEDYIVVGPYRYSASGEDCISQILVKKNGENNYNDIKPGSNILVLSKTPEGTYKPIYSLDEKNNIINDKISPEFYVLVRKNKGIAKIDDLKLIFKRTEIKGTIYYLSYTGGTDSQNLIYVTSEIDEKTYTLNYKVNLIPPVQVELDKVDTAGDAVEGAKFSIEYSNGLKGETKAVGKDGKIVFSQVQPTSPDEFTATITETFTPAGYKKLEKPIVLKFTYDQNKAVWKVEKISGPDEKITIGTVTKDSKSGINKIPVTVENKSIIEKLTLSKTSSVGGEAVAGAKFKLTLTNIASIKGYKIPTTGTPTIIVTTDKNGNIVLEDIEIADLSKDIVITMEETEAPVGYKKIDGEITVKLKREGNTYTVSETKKDNTVTDDEFEAGKVTLKNHELKLDIKDIPVMNLGGIVWTEKIKTGKKQPDINNTYSESDDEALGGVEVRLLDGNNNVIATTTTAKQDGEKVTYLNNLGKEVTVELKQGQYLFTKLNKLNNGTNYIPVGTDYKVEIDYDGITYNPLINPDASMLYKNKEDNKGVFSKITSEDDHGLADGTKTISGTENKEQSTTNGDYTINYTLQDEEKIPDKAIYSNVEKDGDQVFVTARSEKYLQKTEDWESIWKDNNGVGEINLDSYVFDINFGLYKKFFDLNLGTDVDSAEIEINGQKTAYTYDQILDGMLDKDLREKLYKTTDDKVDYNLYLAYSDYYYRIDDYKVPGSTDSLGQPYGEALPGKKDENTELQVYVTYTLQINNQSTQHNATGVKVKYSYDDGYEYVGSNGEATVSDEGHNILTISNINNVVPGEKPKEITLKFKVKKNEDGTFFKAPSDTSKYTNVAEIVEYSTTEGRLVDADSAPGNTFLGENKPTDRREDDTDTANGIVITFKKNAERSISGKVFEDSDKNSTQNGEEQAINDVIVQLIELVEIDGKQQYEYIWQETVAGSNTVKTTDRNGYPGKIYEYKKSDDENPSGKMVEQEINGEAGYCIYVDETNSDGQYKFVNIIPGNYIVRFIYGDGSTYDIRENTLKYNGEDYKSTYVDYNYNAEWYNDTSLNGDNSKAVDNEARRLKVMSYAVDVDGNKGKTLNALNNITDTSKQAEIINAYKNLKKIGEAEAVQWNDVQKDVLANTWMCAETLKIKVPVDPSVLVNENGEKEEKLSITENSTSVKKADSQYKVTFDNVNLGLMERPKTKLVLEKYITGLTVKPVASGVNLIANATADINDILKATQGSQIELEGQKDGLFATKSGRTNRGSWYLQTDTTELAQGADAYITYTYVIKNEGDGDYLNNVLVDLYEKLNADEYKQKLEEFEAGVKNAKKDSTSEEYKKGQQYKNGTYISDFYYTGTKGENDKEVLASVEQIQEALNPKVKFVNSTTDFNIIKNQDGSTLVENKNVYKEDGTGITEEEIKEQIESTKGTGKMELNGRDTSKKLVVSVGLSASEIENSGVYDSYIAQVTHYTNAAGRRDQSTPANLSYVHSYDTNKTLKDYNEEDEFWAETFRITKPTGEDKITPVQIAIITISAVAVLGVGIILIKKFVLKK